MQDLQNWRYGIMPRRVDDGGKTNSGAALRAGLIAKRIERNSLNSTTTRKLEAPLAGKPGAARPLGSAPLLIASGGPL